jgi:hypothetical protein
MFGHRLSFGVVMIAVVVSLITDEGAAFVAATGHVYFALPRAPTEPPVTLVYEAAGHKAGGVTEVAVLHYVLREVVPPFCHPIAQVSAPDGSDVARFQLNATARSTLRFEAPQIGNYRIALSLLCAGFGFHALNLATIQLGNVTIDAYLEGLDPTLPAPHATLDLAPLAAAGAGSSNESSWADEPVFGHESDAWRVGDLLEELDAIVPAFAAASDEFLAARPEFHDGVVALHRRVVLSCVSVMAILVAVTVVQTWQLQRLFRERKAV